MSGIIEFDLGPVYQLGLDPKDGKLAGNGRYYKFNCPFCVENGEPTPDIKQRFHIRVSQDSEFGSFHCFRCGKRGKVGSTLTLNFSLLRAKRRKLEEIAKTKAIINLPSDYSEITPNMFAFEYLMKRGISLDNIPYYNIGIGKSRIIFPDYFDGKLVYWTARAYDGRKPKYWTCPSVNGVERDSQIYNLGRFMEERYDRLILVEGPISAVIGGKNVVATYGKSISTLQIERLRSLDIKAIYVAFDPDARMASIKLARKFIDAFDETYLVPIPKRHDPATLGREQFQQLVVEKSLRLGYDTPDVPIKFMLSD